LRTGSRRLPTLLWVGIASVVLGMLAVALTPRPPANAAVEQAEEAVALGMLDSSVLDDLRTKGEARAIVHLNTTLILDKIRATIGEDRFQDLIAAMDAAFATAKDSIRALLGDQDAIVQDFLHLGAFVVDFRTEGALVSVLGSGVVSSVEAETPIELEPEDDVDLGADLPSSEPTPALGDGVFVGVLDTGVNAGRYPAYFPAGSIAGTFEAAPDDGAKDDQGHGTHVSSIVLMAAPKAKLYVADVFEAVTTGSGARVQIAYPRRVLAGMDWLIGLKAEGINIRAVNISLGDGHVPPRRCRDRHHLAEAQAAGIIPVVAAGNLAYKDEQRQPTSVFQPGIGNSACSRHALSVGSVTNGSCSNGQVDTISRFSQTSEALDIYAPGACIRAAGGRKSGTSMSAPYVAGAVAVLASDGGAPADAIWVALVETGPAIKDGRSGITRNRLDVPAALAYLRANATTLAPTLEPSRRVEIGALEMTLPGKLAPGEAMAVGSFLIQNAGNANATYAFTVLEPAGSGARPMPASWLDLSPATLTLEPGALARVSTTARVPTGAAPGSYSAVVRPVDSAGPQEGPPADVTITIAVGGSGETQVATQTAGAGTTGGPGPSDGSSVRPSPPVATSTPDDATSTTAWGPVQAVALVAVGAGVLVLVVVLSRVQRRPGAGR
jgi:hypothetical protein